MRHQNREYLSTFLQEHGPFAKVLEVGSLHVNGIVSDLFDSNSYTGVDMRTGDNVTEVVNGHDLLPHFGPETFDLVFCFDTLEHDDAFWETVTNMRAVLKPSGWLMIAVPSRHCPEHDHPNDYWRFMAQSMSLMLKDFINVEVKVDHDAQADQEDEIIGWGQKV